MANIFRLFTQQTRAVQRLLVIWFIIIIIAFVNFKVLAPSGGNDEAVKKGDGGGEEKDIDDLVMKRHENEVPIVIVDQHQEVIPYWFKAVKENIILPDSNVLIHIDGHSDMAPPENVDIVKKFISNTHEKWTQNSHLPLMQANDRFIISAIMTGLINKVVWIKPDWDNPKHEASMSQMHVGTTMYGKTDGKRTVCLCSREFSLKSNKPRNEASCFYFGEDTENSTDSQVTIPKKACRKIKSFRSVILSESLFRTVYKTKNLQSDNVILDIDEDYFGVESGVQAFINAGISMDEIYMLNEMLSDIYCPISVEHESQLNDQLKNMFLEMSKMRKMEEELTDKYISYHTSKYFCTEESISENLEILILYVKTLSKKVLKALSTLKYCNTNSFRLLKTFQNDKNLDMSSSFTLCHGTIFPEDTLNQIFVDSKEGIKSRAQNLTTLLDYIFDRAKPGLFTIARSLRDGFTPRKQQRIIEDRVLDSVKEILKKRKLSGHFIYDQYLVFGKNGWEV